MCDVRPKRNRSRRRQALVTLAPSRETRERDRGRDRRGTARPSYAARSVIAGRRARARRGPPSLARARRSAHPPRAAPQRRSRRRTLRYGNRSCRSMLALVAGASLRCYSLGRRNVVAARSRSALRRNADDVVCIRFAPHEPDETGVRSVRAAALRPTGRCQRVLRRRFGTYRRGHANVISRPCLAPDITCDAGSNRSLRTLYAEPAARRSD